MKITIAKDPVLEKPRTKEEFDEYFGGLKFKTGNFPISYWKEIIENGYTVTYCFKDEEFKRIKGYQKDNYLGTEFIVVDVDELDEDPDTFVSKLKYQPTIYHTTFSNLTEYKNNKPCIHLIYCFDEFIPGEKNFNTIFDKLVEKREDIKAQDEANDIHCDTIKFDKKARDCHRCIFTSNKNLKGFIYWDKGRTYHMSEFIEEKEDTLDNFFEDDKLCKNELPLYIVKEKEEILEESKITQSGSFKLNKEFLNELYSTPREEFVKSNSIRYDFYTSTRIDPSMYNDRGYADLRGIDYFQVPSAQYRWDHTKNKPVIQKIKNGERNNTLWLDAIAFMLIISDITPENLVYCLVREVYERYINEDKELSNKFIIAKAKEVWDNIEKIDKRPVRRKFKINMPYWKNKGITDLLYIVRMIKKDMKDNDFGMYYDFCRTIEYNVKELNELGIKTKKETLKKWLEENNLDYTTDRHIRNNFIIELHKQGKSTREIERICKDEGINVSNKTAANVINKLCKNEPVLYIVKEIEEILEESKITQQETKSNKDMDKQIDNWITEVTDMIENDPFFQTHRGREYAIKIGLIKDDTLKVEKESIPERIDQIQELNHTLF